MKRVAGVFAASIVFAAGRASAEQALAEVKTPWSVVSPCTSFSRVGVIARGDGEVMRTGAVTWRGRESMRLQVPGSMAVTVAPFALDALEVPPPRPLRVLLNLDCSDGSGRVLWKCDPSCGVADERVFPAPVLGRRYLALSRRAVDSTLLKPRHPRPGPALALARVLLQDLFDLLTAACADGACAAGPSEASQAVAAALAVPTWRIAHIDRTEALIDAGAFQLTLTCLSNATCTVSLASHGRLLVDYRPARPDCGPHTVAPNCQWPEFLAALPGWTCSAHCPRNDVPTEVRWSIEVHTALDPHGPARPRRLLVRAGAALRRAGG